MTLDHPQNILLNINSIQHNIESLNKSQNILLKPSLTQKSLIFPINNNCLLNNNNNNSKEDTSNLSVIKNTNQLQNDSTLQIKSNPKYNHMNNMSNSYEEGISFKTTYDSLFNLDNLNNIHIKNRIDNNKTLIKPKFYKESNNTDKKNKSFLDVTHSHLKIKKKKQIKGRKICNKFKISHIENKNKIPNRLTHKRKYKPDDIRKKIKARFHKSIKNIINENLKRAGSKFLFSFLPQIFISSIAREKNHQVFSLTYRELLEKDFVSEIDENKYKNKKVDLSKYKNNLRVLEYLDQNPEICKNSGFDIISKMKYSDLLDEYFKSDEFSRAIKKLKEENEEEDYINEYVKKAKSYVSFFSQVPFKVKLNKIKKNEIIKLDGYNNNNNQNVEIDKK